MGVTDESVRVTLRLPEALRNSLLQNARGNRRSMNSEILSVLETYSGASTLPEGGNDSIEELMASCRGLSGESLSVLLQLTRLMQRR